MCVEKTRFTFLAEFLLSVCGVGGVPRGTSACVLMSDMEASRRRGSSRSLMPVMLRTPGPNIWCHLRNACLQCGSDVETRTFMEAAHHGPVSHATRQPRQQTHQERCKADLSRTFCEGRGGSHAMLAAKPAGTLINRLIFHDAAQIDNTAALCMPSHLHKALSCTANTAQQSACLQNTGK